MIDYSISLIKKKYLGSTEDNITVISFKKDTELPHTLYIFDI